MSHFLFAYTSWCRADLGGCLSVIQCHALLQLGTVIRDWFGRWMTRGLGLPSSLPVIHVKGYAPRGLSDAHVAG
jgi:hypothetical protein